MSSESPFFHEAILSDFQEQQEQVTQNVTFHTVPSTYASSRFNHNQEYDRICEIAYRGGEKQVLRGFGADWERDCTAHSFQLPTTLVQRLQSYVDMSYTYRNAEQTKEQLRKRVRNCYQFGASMADIVNQNFYNAAQLLNERIDWEPVDTERLLPGTLLVIAHPMIYKDYGGIKIDHALVSLDNKRAIQVMGIGGPLGITSYDYILEQTRDIMISGDRSIWMKKQAPRTEDIQLRKVLV
ncbi:MAG: hypothetical protein ACREHC_02395 [Candidatus Levyibacteriota bacterium]